jgi:hypothetical protein
MAVNPPQIAPAFRLGLEDAIILPVVTAALALKALAKSAVSILIHILDYAFLIAMELARFPLFVARALGDGVIAVLRGVLTYLPLAQDTRLRWREFIAQKWARIRQAISYQAFEQAVHHAFERGMDWVFRKCRTLSPRTAFYVIIAAKSKLLVLPVYPAAWPQAKKHPLIQTVAQAYCDFERLFLIQKLEHRYRQTERAIASSVVAMHRFADRIGLSYGCNVLWHRVSSNAVRAAETLRGAPKNIFERLSKVWLIGPVLSSYASHLTSIKRRNDKISDKVKRGFDKWFVKFSAEYYEIRDAERAARTASDVARSAVARMSEAKSGMSAKT